MKHAKISYTLILVSLFLISTTSGYGAVYVFDMVASREKPIQLMVLTKGKLFASGGKLIDVYLDDLHLGRILSGGDGYGYIKYIPRNTGFKTVRAVSGGYENTGLVLVAEPKSKTLCVEVETALSRTFLTLKAKTDMAAALKDLSREYTLVYLSRFVGPINARKLMNKSGCPRAVTLRWRGTESLDELKQKGLWLHAVIASAEFLSDTVDYFECRFAFEETEDGTYVENWEAFVRELKDLNPAETQRQQAK